MIFWFARLYKRVPFVFLKSMIRLIQIDGRSRELFGELSSETEIDERINFDIEIVTSFPAIESKVSQKL